MDLHPLLLEDDDHSIHYQSKAIGVEQPIKMMKFEECRTPFVTFALKKTWEVCQYIWAAKKPEKTPR